MPRKKIVSREFIDGGKYEVITYSDGSEELVDHTLDFLVGEDDIPAGCRACGGDYPNCKSGCKLFDD